MSATTSGVPALELELDLALLSKALGHPARVRILQLLLAKDACCCGEIVDELPLAQATVSQHLKVLKEAGLVVGEIEGLRVSYCASRERLAALHGLVGALLEEAKEVDTRGCD
ncbi:MAG TPA: metalloregulator ArsR/SmtB family transcription factor [Gaiellaceae bacterium]|nr:metalloregulator ArsR/SmtB family transcription factor [Gaiellaceae bacterium]